MNLIGLTVEEAIAKIKKTESINEIFQVYVCTKEHKTRNMFKQHKRTHYYNDKGKRIYKIYDFDVICFASDKNLQKDSFILGYEIKREQHDNWGFNGYISTDYHNVYYLYIDGIKKGNKAKTRLYENKQEQEIEYKEGELTKAQRRITL